MAARFFNDSESQLTENFHTKILPQLDSLPRIRCNFLLRLPTVITIQFKKKHRINQRFVEFRIEKG